VEVVVPEAPFVVEGVPEVAASEEPVGCPDEAAPPEEPSGRVHWPEDVGGGFH
jgi:hypothetical protein